MFVGSNLNKDIHEDSMNLDDCHILFISYLHLDKCIWDIDSSNIPFFLGINDAQ
jgi:hypothetical protein